MNTILENLKILAKQTGLFDYATTTILTIVGLLGVAESLGLMVAGFEVSARFVLIFAVWNLIVAFFLLMHRNKGK